MGAAILGVSTGDGPAVDFVLDSYHLAMLDRFVAQARRHARRGGQQFTGVVVEIDATRPMSVHAAGVEPLVLGLGAVDRWAGRDGQSDRTASEHARPRRSPTC